MPGKLFHLSIKCKAKYAICHFALNGEVGQVVWHAPVVAALHCYVTYTYSGCSIHLSSLIPDAWLHLFPHAHSDVCWGCAIANMFKVEGYLLLQHAVCYNCIGCDYAAVCVHTYLVPDAWLQILYKHKCVVEVCCWQYVAG